MILIDLFKALKAGEEISNPAMWKKGTMSVTAITTIITVLFRTFAPSYGVPDDLIDALSQIVMNVLVAINIFMMKATSKKV